METYDFSYKDKQIENIRELFNLILVKKNIQIYTTGQLNRQVYAFVKYQNKSFILGSLHLAASEMNYEYREK